MSNSPNTGPSILPQRDTYRWIALGGRFGRTTVWNGGTRRTSYSMSSGPSCKPTTLFVERLPPTLHFPWFIPSDTWTQSLCCALQERRWRSCRKVNRSFLLMTNYSMLVLLRIVAECRFLNTMACTGVNRPTMMWLFRNSKGCVVQDAHS